MEWNQSGNEEISNMSKANIISDLQVSLKENNGIANIPSDLFYGQVTLHKNSSTKSTVSNELQIIRKTSIFQLSTKGLIKYLGVMPEILNIELKYKSSLDYNGNPTGEEVEFAFPASFDEKGNLTTETQAIFPAQNITVELYKDGNLIFLAKKTKMENYSLQPPENAPRSLSSTPEKFRLILQLLTGQPLSNI